MTSEQTLRSENDPVADIYEREGDKAVVDAIERVAATKGVSMAQVALAWVLRNPTVSAPIVGATKPHHLPDAVATLDVHLTDDEAAAVETPYRPQDAFWIG